MISRDMDIEITLNMKRRFIDKLPLKEKKIEINTELERILIIGPNGYKKCHFSENIYLVACNEGFDVKFFAPQDLKLTVLQTQRERSFNVNELLNMLKKENGWKPQLIIVDECGLYIDNFTSIPLFYHHREFKRPPTVFYPTAVFFWHRDIADFYKKQFAPLWLAQVQNVETIHVATNPELFKLSRTKKSGITGIGGRESFSQAHDINELTNIADLMILEQETEAFKKVCDTFHESPVSDEAYRELLPKCETIWIPTSVRQYMSRRMIDAMICKTACIIKLESKRHEAFLEDMGFRNGVHYYGVSKFEEINDIIKNNALKMKDVVNSAHVLALRNHTYKNRFFQMIDLYKKIMKK